MNYEPIKKHTRVFRRARSLGMPIGGIGFFASANLAYRDPDENARGDQCERNSSSRVTVFSNTAPATDARAGSGYGER